MPVLYYARGSSGTFGLTGAGTLAARRAALAQEILRLKPIAQQRGKAALVTELNGWYGFAVARLLVGPNVTQVTTAENRVRTIGTLLTTVTPLAPVAPPPSVVSPPAPGGPEAGTPAVLPPEGGPGPTDYMPITRAEPPQVYYPPANGGGGDALAAAGISPKMLLVGAAAVVAVILVLRR